MMRTIFAEYNPQGNSIDVYTSVGYMLRIRERYVAVDSCSVELGGWEDWAFLRSLGGFIPAYYNITIESEQGTLKVNAHSANAST